MSVEFSNKYQEVLLDNLMTIIKQNFIFQTQLQMTEDVGKQKADLEAKFNEVVKQLEAIQPKVAELESYKSKVMTNESAHTEKGRIQVALNDSLQKNTTLKKQLDEKDLEIAGLKEHIEKVESMLPVSKLKKVNPEKAASLPTEPTKDLPNDGSSF